MLQGSPAGNIVDKEAIAEMATAKSVPLIIDNTVAPPPRAVQPHCPECQHVVHSVTKFMGGHGNTLGAVIVGGGNFPWADHAERFPCMTQPEPAYHGVIYTEAFGPAAFIGRARTVPFC